jgi:hypothetical protein
MTRVGFALLLAGALLACAPPIWTEVNERQEAPVVRTIAMLPFDNKPAPGGSIPSDASQVVAARVLEALTEETELVVIPPDKVMLVPGSGGATGREALRKTFGADAVLTGTVRRYIERSGGPSGSTRPSAVWFTLELRAIDGALIWSGTYNETQAALSDDLGSFRRAWQRGFKWVTAADLANYGARELARALAEEIGPWS